MQVCYLTTCLRKLRGITVNKSIWIPGCIDTLHIVSISIKELAKVYGVTYPTIRLRLDRLIQKIKMTESKEQDEYIALIKRLAFNEKLDLGVAQLLVSEYKKMKAKSEE